MDHWDVVLLVVAGYLAAMSLVRLMARRRNDLLAELHDQANSARRQQKSKGAGREGRQPLPRRDKAA